MSKWDICAPEALFKCFGVIYKYYYIRDNF